MRCEAAMRHAIVLSHVKGNLRQGQGHGSECDSKQGHMRVPVRNACSEVLHVEKWMVGYYSGQTGIRAREAGADEYGRIVDPWSNDGSVRAERRILHLASVTRK